MEVWILFSEEIESPTAEAFEIRRFLAEGREMGIDVKVFNPEQFDLLVTSNDRNSIIIDGNPVTLPDFVLPRTYVIDTGYFPLAIIRQLERLGVRVFNNADAIERVSDKLHTHQVLAEYKLPTPDTMLARFPVDVDLVENSVGFPVVVKTLLGVNGTGVFLIHNRDAFADLMGLISETTPNVQLIFQQYVEVSKGRDLRVFVVDGKVIASMERTAAPGSFKANYSQGGSVKEFALDDNARELALKTSEVLDLQVSGVDLLFTADGGYTICEANSFPGFKGLESCCNVNVPKEIYTAMLNRLEKEKAEKAAAEKENVSANVA